METAKNYKGIIGVVIVAGIAIVLMLALAFGGGSVNANGSQLPTPINVADPDTQELIQDFTVLADKNDVLQHSEKLDPLKAALQKLVQAASGQGTAYPKLQSKEQVGELAKKMLAEIEDIQVKANAGNQKAAASVLDQLLKDKEQLDALGLGSDNAPAAVAPKDGFALPLRAEDQTGWYNASPHGTMLHKKPGHGVLLGGRVLYGENIDPSDYGEATDVGAPAGATIYAPFTGKVLKSGCLRANNNCSAGNALVIQSPDGRFVTALVHLNTAGLPAVGTTVQVGTKVGTTFSLKSNPHLHFELWVDRHAVRAGSGTGNVSKRIWENQKRALGFTQ